MARWKVCCLFGRGEPRPVRVRRCRRSRAGQAWRGAIITEGVQECQPASHEVGPSGPCRTCIPHRPVKNNSSRGFAAFPVYTAADRLTAV